jgi:hypothetical protein
MRGRRIGVALGAIGLLVTALPAAAQRSTPPAPTVAPGTSAAARMTSLAAVTAGNEALAGRSVLLRDVKVESIDRDGNFVVGTGSHRILVVPAIPPAGPLDVGNTMDIQGTIMKMTPQLTADLRGRGVNSTIYVYALGARQ